MGDLYEDFQEEDVWAVMRESSPRARRYREQAPPAAPRRLPAAARMIPRSGAHADGNEGGGGRVLRQSAPVNIPHWPKKYMKKGPLDDHRYGDGNGLGYDQEEPEPAGGFSFDDDADDEDGMVPPHEWIARKLARSQISSFSMCEGAGRTLKGRDLSKVRNAVLTRTGFLE